MIRFPVCPLFVPANKLDWIEKAKASNADALILDLEDSVSLQEKKETREGLMEHLSSQELNTPYLIRINPLNTNEGQRDLSLLDNVTNNFVALLIPKVETLEELSFVPKSCNVILLIETPLAIKNLEILASDKRVQGLCLGGADLSAELGSDMSWDALLYSRSKLVLHASINNIFSIDSPFMEIDKSKQLEEECLKAKALGFTSKAAIHPGQVEIIKRNFLPTEDEIKEAKKILKQYAGSSKGVIAVDGKMVDEPVVKSMQKKLLLAGFDPDELK